MRARLVIFGAVLVVCGTAPGAEPPAGQPKGTTGKVEAVILYRGQALVTRLVPVEEPAGRIELLVTGLPDQVDPDSLFAEPGDGIAVRAVRYRARAVGEDPREAVRKLDAEMEAANDRLARNQRLQQVLQQRLAYLDKLENFVPPTATLELARGVLNAEAVRTISLFNFDQRKAAAEEQLKLQAEERDIRKELDLIAKRRNEIAEKSSREEREALLFLDKTGAGRTWVRLSYLVNSAGWSPAYNFRAGRDGGEFRVEYNALVYQRSGEDWNGVDMTLSTASPALSCQAPGLAPFRVALGGGRGVPVQPAQTTEQVETQVRSSLTRRNLAEQGQQKAGGRAPQFEYNWAMNVAANDIQFIELASRKEALHVLRQAAAEEPSVSYRLPGTVSLASRHDHQLIRVSEIRLQGRMYYVAAPVLTGYVYREAELTNTAEDALLAGPISAYLDGRFVGKGEIPTVARGQTFVIGMGADGRIRARRELADKTEGVQGGNRELGFKYRIVLENFHDSPVMVRVQDRIPISERETDIRVTLGEMSDKLSEDKVYLRVERPKGILRWDVEVPAGAAGEKARMIEYNYKLEYDRNLSVISPAASRQEDLQEEFKAIQDLRIKK